MTVRDTSAVGLAPQITSIYHSQNGINQCMQASIINITCVHVHEKLTAANPKSENKTENCERQFLKKGVLRSVLEASLSAQFSHHCQNKKQNMGLRLKLGQT